LCYEQALLLERCTESFKTFKDWTQMISLGKTLLFQNCLLTLLLAGGIATKADTISNNLSNTTAGTEAASGSTWLTASFGTGASSDTLSSVTLLLSNPASGVAEVDLYRQHFTAGIFRRQTDITGKLYDEFVKHDILQ
jgi:hypothetical protein